MLLRVMRLRLYTQNLKDEIMVVILRTDIDKHYSVFTNTVYRHIAQAEAYILTLDPNNAVNKTYMAVKLEKF